MEELLIISKLVRISVLGMEEEIPAGVNWPKVFVDAGVNGVSAICYEAVKRLPASVQPDFGLMLRWDVSAQGIKEGFRHRHKVTGELRDILAGRGVDMLLLKGETLANNYPQPELRESGDVDFVALAGLDPQAGFAACNSFVESLGMKLESQEKHSSFEYRGVHFENHTLEHTAGYNRVHHRTMALLKESLPKAVRRSDGCLELDPVTQAVFVVKHAAQHLCYSGGKIALRMLLDLALLLRRHPEVLEEWDSALKSVGLRRFAKVMLCATEMLLGEGLLPGSAGHRLDPGSGSGFEFCPGSRHGWSHRARRRARMFIRLFLTESNRPVRYFAKFAFLPLRPSEVLGICFRKVCGRRAY